MRPLLSLLAAVWTLMAVPAWAESHPVVVELFTSQGCSSCPPADRMLEELAQRDDVIALALHVDYWDYIGWKDSFASPAHTERQKAYASAANRRSVYTPQMIVNGSDAVKGAKGMQLAEFISAHAARPAQVDLMLERRSDQLHISARVVGDVTEQAMIVQLVRYIPERTVAITHGENAGRTLSYSNVVHVLEILAEWDGRAPLELTTPITGTDPLAVLVQYTGHGPIVGAARLD